MTYLEMVNNVLIRLRETQVSSLDQNNYSTLVSRLVLDAYRIVEDSHDWSTLRDIVNVATVISQPKVELTDTPVDSNVLGVYYADNWELKRVSREWLETRRLQTTDETGEPRYYAIEGANTNSANLELSLWPIPDGVYTIRVQAAKRGTEPTIASSNIILPTQPIMHLALALATRERGETGGTSAADYMAMFSLSLSSAISRDANHRPDELLMYV